VIAEHEDLSLRQLCQLNGVNPNDTIYPGQKLLLVPAGDYLCLASSCGGLKKLRPPYPSAQRRIAHERSNMMSKCTENIHVL